VACRMLMFPHAMKCHVEYIAVCITKMHQLPMLWNANPGSTAKAALSLRLIELVIVWYGMATTKVLCWSVVLCSQCLLDRWSQAWTSLTTSAKHQWINITDQRHLLSCLIVAYYHQAAEFDDIVSHIRHDGRFL
jgi:hypothetical protein